MKRSIKYLLFIPVFFLCSNRTWAQQVPADSLNVILKAAKHDTTRLRITLDICEVCEVPEMLKYTESALNLANKLLDQRSSYPENTVKWILRKKALALNDFGYCYYNQGDLFNALKYYNESLKLYEDIDDKQGLAVAYNNIGAIYDSQGAVSKALDAYRKSLELEEELGDKNGMARSFNNLAVIYYQQNDEKKALLYYSKSLELYEAIGEKLGIASVLNNIGNTYDQAGDTSKTLYYFQKALKIMQEIGHQQGVAGALSNIGDIFVKQKNIPLALDYYKEALQINKEIESKDGVAHSFNNIGAVYFYQKDLKLATRYLDSALTVSKELGFPENIRNAERILSRIDSLKGNFEGAFEHYKQFIKYRDSIANKETQKAYITNQLNYEFEKKQDEVKAEHAKEQALAGEQNRRQLIIIWAGAVGALLVVLFAVYVVRSLRITRKQKHIIEEKQKDILDSIHYAKRIQSSLMPSDKFIDKTIDRIRKE